MSTKNKIKEVPLHILILHLSVNLPVVSFVGLVSLVAFTKVCAVTRAGGHATHSVCVCLLSVCTWIVCVDLCMWIRLKAFSSLCKVCVNLYMYIKVRLWMMPL